jgi:diacylglycerol kinase
MKADLIRFLHSFGFAFEGMVHAAQSERNIRVHIVIAGCCVLLGIFLGLSLLEWAVIALAMSGVFTSEMINTAVESLIDLASPEHHPLAKIAKDAAAGAVLVNAAFAAVAGVLIFAPKIWEVVTR